MLDKQNQSLLRNPIHAWSVGFGLGLLPWAPGTWGTLLAIPIFYFTHSWHPYLQWFVWLLTVFFSCYSATKTRAFLGYKDPSCIVCDEVVGCWLALLVVSWQTSWLIFTFILFRAFDILKPWPICFFDSKDSGTAIVIDDLVAGLYTLIILSISDFLT